MPGEGESVLLVVCVVLIEEEKDCVGFVDILLDIDCVILDVSDCDELISRVLELLADSEGLDVILIDNDVDIDTNDDSVGDKLAICVPDTDDDSVGDKLAICVPDTDDDSVGDKLAICVPDTDDDSVGDKLAICVPDTDELTVVLADANELTVVLADADELTVVLADADELTVVLADANELTVVLADADKLTVPDSVSLTDGVDWRVTLDI